MLTTLSPINAIPDLISQVMQFQTTDIIVAILVLIGILMTAGFVFRIPINVLKGRPPFGPVNEKKGT